MWAALTNLKTIMVLYFISFFFGQKTKINTNNRKESKRKKVLPVSVLIWRYNRLNEAQKWTKNISIYVFAFFSINFKNKRRLTFWLASVNRIKVFLSVKKCFTLLFLENFDWNIPIWLSFAYWVIKSLLVFITY